MWWAAMRSPRGASAAILRAVRDGHATLLLSVALALEYATVCLRAGHRLAAGLSSGRRGSLSARWWLWRSR